MIAPRKKLWSTPLGAVDHAIDWIKLKANDCVCDIGCGDGRILLRWAEIYTSNARIEAQNNNNQVSFLGIDIDPERIKVCQKALSERRSVGSIADDISVKFVCANALQDPKLLENANIFFLYLIPRGLKLIEPILQQHREHLESSEIQIISFMNKFPGVSAKDRALVQVDHQPGAEWPLYYYKLEGEEKASLKT